MIGPRPCRGSCGSNRRNERAEMPWLRPSTVSTFCSAVIETSSGVNPS